MAKIDNEAEMYKPIKKLLESLGYTVRGEVKNCDIVAMQDENMIVIEMKRSFNMTVLYQAMDRKALTSNVYVAIPRPKNYRNKNTQMMIKVLKGLGLGLIAVACDGMKKAEIVLEPQKSETRVNKKRSERVKKEMTQRTGDRNEGGVNRKKLITAYKEASVLALCHMEKFETLNTRYLRKLGYMDKVRNAVRNNVYGWFEKVDTATYAMSAEGVEALDSEENRELTEYYRNEVNKNVQTGKK